MVEVIKVRFEIKVMILGVFFSILCMISFTYVSSLTQKTIYTYQVGIYKEEKNKDQKLTELKELGIKGYCYEKDEQFYVLSLISENQKDIENHASQMKGIVKSYVVPNDMTIKDLLDNLAKGKTYD